MNRNVDDMKNQQTLQSSNMPHQNDGTIEEGNSTALGTLKPNEDPASNMNTLPGTETIEPNGHHTIQNQVIQEEDMEGENVVGPL